MKSIYSPKGNRRVSACSRASRERRYLKTLLFLDLILNLETDFPQLYKMRGEKKSLSQQRWKNSRKTEISGIYSCCDLGFPYAPA